MQIKINKASFGYDGEDILKDFSFEVNTGDKIAIIGRNGSGKTTLLKLIAGLLTPTSGQILVCGEPVGTKSKALVRLSFISQTTLRQFFLLLEAQPLEHLNR